MHSIPVRLSALQSPIAPNYVGHLTFVRKFDQPGPRFLSHPSRRRNAVIAYTVDTLVVVLGI